MEASELFHSLTARGIRLVAEGSGLVVIPASKLTDDDREAIRAHKAEILAALQPPTPSESEVERACRLDREQYERDRIARRGYDFDPTAPSHPEYPREDGSPTTPEAETNEALTPAQSLVATCQRFGVALRIDPATGDLVIGRLGAKADKPSQPWPSLLRAIEAHLEAVARLVEAGWCLNAGFPREATA
jgi:hypothetical protein